MDNSATIDRTAHPAPHRDRVRLIELILGVFAPPLAWSVHLAVNYAFASHSCYPDGGPQAVPTFGGLWALLIAVDLVSLVISAAAAVLAYRNWAASSQEHAHGESALVETGEGRTRFLAMWGVLTGLSFFVAVGFDFIGLWILPLCS